MPAKNTVHNSAENDIEKEGIAPENEMDSLEDEAEEDEVDTDDVNSDEEDALESDKAPSVLEMDGQPEEDIGKKINQLRLAKG